MQFEFNFPSFLKFYKIYLLFKSNIWRTLNKILNKSKLTLHLPKINYDILFKNFIEYIEQ